MDLHEIFREGWQLASGEQMIKFWWRSRSGIQIRIQICITTLVRHALAEVCIVPVLLVCYLFIFTAIHLCSIYSVLSMPVLRGHENEKLIDMRVLIEHDYQYKDWQMTDKSRFDSLSTFCVYF